MPRYRPARPVPRAHDKRPGWVAVDLRKQIGPLRIKILVGHTLYVWRDHIPLAWGNLSPQNQAQW